MDSIRQYLLSITAAAIIVGIITNFIGKDSSHGKIIRFLCGLFLALTLVTPWVKINITNVHNFLGSLNTDAGALVADGEAMATNTTASIIISSVKSYILDKASSMGLSLEVEVTLNKTNPPVPYSVSISGSASPYNKQKLQQLIEDDLDIPKERQLWT